MNRLRSLFDMTKNKYYLRLLSTDYQELRIEVSKEDYDKFNQFVKSSDGEWRVRAEQ